MNFTTIFIKKTVNFLTHKYLNNITLNPEIKNRITAFTYQANMGHSCSEVFYQAFFNQIITQLYFPISFKM